MLSIVSGTRRLLRWLLLLLVGIDLLLAVSQHVRLTSGETLRGPPLELDRPPGSVLLRCLELCLARVSEAGAHPKKVLPRRRALDGSAQPKEGVMLDGALPQVLAGFLVVQPKDERVLLLAAVVVVFDHHQGELLLFEIQLADLGPEEKADLLDAFEHQDAGGRQAQMVLAAVLALKVA